MARYLTQNLRWFGLAISAAVVSGRKAGVDETGRLLAGSATLWFGRNGAAH